MQFYVRRIEVQEKTFQNIYSVVWVKFSMSMKNKFQSLADFERKMTDVTVRRS